ncbi:MAG TPA: hypothetical protein VMT93_08700 [Gemmatimonadaceae bacterium]|nr:hypothetical protein [Gemmatimonadaceae bacterium]
MNATRLAGLAALLVPALLAAQMPSAAPAPAPAPSANPVSDAARRMHTRYSNFLNAAAEQVPADKLGYKPTDVQMTFGKIWAHLVEANYGICGAIGGAPAANVPKLEGTEAKDVLVNALKGSFTFCDGVLAKLTDAQMGGVADMGFMKGSTALALDIYLLDLADHYSQVANYMRLNGMVPPSAQPRK